MKHDSNCHRRRSSRLKGYDYSRAGAYLVTVCTQGRACLFGDVVGGEMRLNAAGRVVEQCWSNIPRHFSHVELDEFVVMPNHVHGIVVIIENVGATHASPLRWRRPTHPAGPKKRSIGAVVGSFKSAVTKRINELRNTPGTSIWQRNYYEHVMRDDASLCRIREYIVQNPLQWEYDRENPVGATHASPQSLDLSWHV
jgi:REP element-mobilizing transposase RayT